MADNLPADVSNLDKTAKIQELNALENTMLAVDSSHTLEEQLADMKRRGIDPSKSYKNWDDEDNWGSNNPEAVQQLKENDDVTPPPVI